MRNVNVILDLLAEEMHGKPTLSLADSDVSDDDEVEPEVNGMRGPIPSSSFEDPLRFTEKHALLKLRLAPLRRLQKDLEFAIGAASGEEVYYPPTPTSDCPSVAGQKTRRQQEFFVRSLHAWKADVGMPESPVMQKHKETYTRDAVDVIAGCVDDMAAIWADTTVQRMLLKRRIRLEASPGL